MAKKRKSFYSSIRDLTKVPLRDLKPLKIEKGRHRFHMPLRRRIVTISILCVILMIVTLSLGRTWGPLNTVFNTVASPIQQTMNAIGSWFGSLSTRLEDTDALRKENERLKQQLEALQYENTLQQVKLTRMDELNQLYDLDEYYANYPKEAAQIIAQSPSNWYHSMTIDKGALDGITEYMPVLSGGGLLGHVATVYQHYSRISLLVSEDNYVYGEVLRSGDHVGVEGDAALGRDGLCKIEFYIQQVDIAVGDEIVTSSMSNVYPPGIRIGKVIKIEEKGDGITGIAYVEPFAELENLSYVLIVTDNSKKPDLTIEEAVPANQTQGPDVSGLTGQTSSPEDTSVPEDSASSQEGNEP